MHDRFRRILTRLQAAFTRETVICPLVFVSLVQRKTETEGEREREREREREERGEKRKEEKARAGKISAKEKRKTREKKFERRDDGIASRRARGRCLKSSSARLSLPVFVCPSRERECCSAVGSGARARLLVVFS